MDKNKKLHNFSRIHIFQIIAIFLLLILINFTTAVHASVNYQGGPTETATPTETQVPTNTATSAPAQGQFERPVVVINFYHTNPNPVNAGQDFDLSMEIYNAGQTSARNILISFVPGGFLPRDTGGVIAVPNIFPGNRQNLDQAMTAGWDLWGQSVSTLDINVNYTDMDGNPYSEKFTLSINLNVPRVSGSTATPTPTVTPTRSAVDKPQIVIVSYETDINPLEPGSAFQLKLHLSNMGNADADRVTMIVGGGGATNNGGTLEPGGIPGSSGEFTNFAPLGSSNIQSIGNIPSGSNLTVTQALIVNVTTSPGAYPMRIAFTYLTNTGVVFIDEQVITLLVYDLPRVDLSFYRDPNPIFTGQVNMLPLQITNLGKKTVILGNLRVSAPNGILENNVMLIGPLDAGGYFTLDATYIPDFPGPVSLEVSVDYTDDFNQPRQIQKSIEIEVQEFLPPEEPIPGEGEPGIINPDAPETFGQKAWRFILGLLGFNSGPKQAAPAEGIPTDGGVPVESGESSRPIKGP